MDRNEQSSVMRSIFEKNWKKNLNPENAWPEKVTGILSGHFVYAISSMPKRERGQNDSWFLISDKLNCRQIDTDFGVSQKRHSGEKRRQMINWNGVTSEPSVAKDAGKREDNVNFHLCFPLNNRISMSAAQ